jgi:hypothetical protein
MSLHYTKCGHDPIYRRNRSQPSTGTTIDFRARCLGRFDGSLRIRLGPWVHSAGRRRITNELSDARGPLCADAAHFGQRGAVHRDDAFD